MRSHPEIKPAIWGAIAGAVAITVVGFWAFGWTLSSSAERMAANRAGGRRRLHAHAGVHRQVRGAGAGRCRSHKLAESRKISPSWDKRSFVEKGGWATTPGSAAPNSDVATACAEEVGKAT